MKRLLICVGAFLITATILYAQPSSDRHPPAPRATGEESLQAPKAIGEEQWQWLKEEFPEKYEKLMQLKEKTRRDSKKKACNLEDWVCYSD